MNPSICPIGSGSTPGENGGVRSGAEGDFGALGCILNDRGARARLAAMSALASVMAHELSQPLTASSNYLQVAMLSLRQQTGSAEELMAMLERANAQALRAAELVRRMRMFVLDGTVERRPENVDAMVQGACQNLRGFGDIEVSWAFGHAGHEVLVDRLQIETVLSNLLMNAVQALQESAVRRITVRTWLGDGTLFICVEDTGPGVPEGCSEQLFEPCFTTKANGTGLGLAICQTIVDAHGGLIWSEQPASGQGAAFVLALPDSPPRQEMGQTIGPLGVGR